MLKIGDLSKLANVTVKALRLYADMGLLRPAWIDRFTGYRYYSLDQLPRLNRILALKDLGLSLEQIQRVLDANLSADELRGMLNLKQAELQQKVRTEQMRLAQVEARLEQIEREGRLSVEAVAVRQVDALLVAYTTLIAPSLDLLRERREAAQRRIEDWLRQSRVSATGPWVVVHNAGEYLEQDIPIEIGVGLEAMPGAPLPPNGRVLVRQLPALAQAAVYAHTGPLEHLPDAYATLYSWVETNGYRICGVARELYWIDDAQAQDGSDRPAARAVEVMLPVEPIAYPTSLKEHVMEPEIIEYHSFLVAGTVYEGDNRNQEIAVMWGKDFMPNIHKMKRADNYVTYGVCEMDPSLPEGHMRYYASAEIARPEDAPPEFAVKRVPAGKYAVFKHVGALEDLRKTYEYINQVWLPKSGYKRADRPDLEVYTHEFHDFQPDSVLYLWVPVE